MSQQSRPVPLSFSFHFASGLYLSICARRQVPSYFELAFFRIGYCNASRALIWGFVTKMSGSFPATWAMDRKKEEKGNFTTVTDTLGALQNNLLSFVQ